MKSERLVCVFLVPIVRDSDRQPHQPILWDMLRDALLRAFRAVTGPETVICYRDTNVVPGAWSPGESKAPIEDLNRRYTVAIPATQMEDLRALLRRVGNSFDQQVMYLEVAGHAELLEVLPTHGFLEI